MPASLFEQLNLGKSNIALDWFWLV